MPPGTGSVLTGKKLNAVLAGLLGVATLILYSPVVGYSFVVLDDHDYVVANPHIRGGFSWKTIRWAFMSTDSSNWHPLTWLSHALDYQLFALNPAGHHLDSVLIHALNAALLFLVLAWVTKRVGPSLLVATLFAVHPLNVESVAWVAERKNVLSTLFFFLAIGAYAWYAQKPQWKRYLVVAALFGAGLMAKPMVITLPFVLLLLDYWPLGRTPGSPASPIGAPQLTISKLALEKMPLLVLSAGSAWITLVAQRSAYSVRNLEEYPLAIRINNAIVAYGLYLWKMLWPTRLAVLYPHLANTLPMGQVALSALILAGITTLVLAFRRRRYLPVGWFWFLGTLIPVIGLVQVGGAAMADRYAYIPLIGIFVMIAWGLDDWAEIKKVRTLWRVIPALCVLMVLAFVTLRQMSHWENEYTLWAHTVAVTERNGFAHASLAAAIMNPDLAAVLNTQEGLDTEEKRTEEARRNYEEALVAYRQLVQRNPDTYLPDMATTLSNLGNVARLQNQTEEARQHYEEALRYYQQLTQQNPSPHWLNMATTLSNLAAVEELQNRSDEAHQHYEESLKIRQQLAQQDPDKYLPDVVDILIKLGFLERFQKQPDKAYLDFEEALKIGRQLAQKDPGRYLPSLANRLVNLGNFETEQHWMDRSRQHYEEALQIYRQLAQENPEYSRNVAATLNNLGLLERDQKQNGQAYVHFEEALQVYSPLAQQNPATYLPNVAATLNNLGRLDGVQNRMDEARQHFEGALNIYRQLAQRDPNPYLPDLAGTLTSVGYLDQVQKRIEESRVHYTEAAALYQKLAQRDPAKYGGDAARVEANLRELDRKVNSR
ncbi:MAG: tetratricopeptide repeat protein [Terriglobales bacterium]